MLLQDPHVLLVRETSSSQQLDQAFVGFSFPSALFPQAVLAFASSGYHLVVLSAQGVLYAIHLPKISSFKAGISVLSGTPQVSTISLQVRSFWTCTFHEGVENWSGMLGWRCALMSSLGVEKRLPLAIHIIEGQQRHSFQLGTEDTAGLAPD